jgi:hypothetical protein
MPTTTSPPSIVRASGYYGVHWPASGAIPEKFSSGKWTVQSRGFPQQTFLGASIRSFTANGGFGDSTSTLGVELVTDEFNVSDKTAAGIGDDVYHSGIHDKFVPPMVGSPVFFKFGESFATVEEAYRKTFDDLYNSGVSTYPAQTTATAPGGSYNPQYFDILSDNTFVDLSNNTISGNINPNITNHFVFGGILQSYTQNRGPGGSPVYSAQVVDPREILANTTLILNNYAGSTYKSKNMLNIYGFLEYNPTSGALTEITKTLNQRSQLVKQFTIDVTNNVTDVWFSGSDVLYVLNDSYVPSAQTKFLPKQFPITGTGFSRRGPQGMPFYRLKQSVAALMQINGALPKEYIDKGFSGLINFRGFNYVVDFGSLPSLPDFYYIDYDQINMLELALEICEASSRELFVSLLPVINHKACQFLYDYNTTMISSPLATTSDTLGAGPSGLIAGIIRIDTIDRSSQPAYGSIKNYIDLLASGGLYVENQDVGFELSNITTDKFIVGAQEVNMYAFSTNGDRDTYDINKRRDGINTDLLPQGYQWKLESSLEQQVLPYYGKLGGTAVTIPKGFGPFQQILLDSTGLNANGVGNYYVATEMELRACLISFDKWKEFLKMYNDIYLESIEFDDAEESQTLLSATNPDANKFPPIEDISDNYCITVPRSLFTHYAPSGYGTDKLPFSPCNPPYGYPLYYKRMTKLGIPEGGLTDVQVRLTSVITSYANLRSSDNKNIKHIVQSELTRLKDLKENSTLSQFEIAYYEALEDALKAVTDDDITKAVVLIEELIDKATPSLVSLDLSKTAKKNTANALKVYNFLRNIAEECLGKKFLVKIPNKVNLNYKNIVEQTPSSNGGSNIEYLAGPFGFKPMPIDPTPGYEFSTTFKNYVTTQKTGVTNNATIKNAMKLFLDSGVYPTGASVFTGALCGNYNPISEKHEFNYEPLNIGGFYNYDLYQNTISNGGIEYIRSHGFNKLPKAVQQCLIPIDLSNFINENGRVSAYVRFDSSQYLAFDNMDNNGFTQQTITAEGLIPDFCENLDNVSPVGNEFHAFPADNINSTTPPPKTVAFVRCDVDENFYMPPKTFNHATNVHGQSCKELKVFTPPRKIYDACSGIYLDSFSYYKTKFVPDATAGESVNIINFVSGVGLMANMVDTRIENLDNKNVYALITLPQRVIPTKDGRFRDGPMQNANAEKFKHYMTMDVIKGLQGFDKINNIDAIYEGIRARTKSTPAGNITEGLPINSDIRIQAFLAAKKAVDSTISFGFPNVLQATFPSPVYPDLVVLPLLSKERCYGPWISSQLDGAANAYINIGGRVEFIKDENLAPWNYAGYELMTQAGRMQAQFSNSLLLFSERGGFTYPGPPSGNSLCRALQTGGPLVTNIQVDVSEAGIKTTYRLDLYTSSFGKLQKQKQDHISKIGRERQKLKDERNALIRKGLGKSQSNVNYQSQYEKLTLNISTQPKPLSNIVVSSDKRIDKKWSSAGGDRTVSEYLYDGSIQDASSIHQSFQDFLEEDSLANSYYNSASASISDLFSPMSNEPYHPNMSYRPNPNSSARKSLYFNEDTPFSQNDIE